MVNRQIIIVLVVGIVVSDIESRPQKNEVKDIYPVYRSDKQLNSQSTTSSSTTQSTTQTTSSSSSTTQQSKHDIDKIANVARATPDKMPIKLVPLSPADMAEARGQMVDADTRTPPKLKEIINEKTIELQQQDSAMVVDKIEANGRFDIDDSSEGKSSGMTGIAVPVLMDDFDVTEKKPHKKMEKVPEPQKPNKVEKKKTNTKVRDDVTTTPSSGLSTWILLSDNRDATTPSNKKKNNSKDDKTKKPQKLTTPSPEKERNNGDHYKSTDTTTKKVAKPLLTKVPAKTTESPISALEAMVKQKKDQSTTTTTSTTNKPKTSTKKPSKDKAETKDKIEILLGDDKKQVITISPKLPLTTENSLEVENSSVENQNSTEASTKKKKTSSKKKKKNKNRRKNKPSNNSTELDVKKVPKQPVGAQLYSYLSREIMPTVGLGLVGVLVTAGLAGLLGYNPFVAGGLPIRRTYESKHGYGTNYYNPSGFDSDGGKSEEVLFGEVLQGMPDESRYSLSSSNSGYPETQLYSSQEQAYGNKDKDSYTNEYDAYYNNEDPGTSYVYPEKSSRKEGYATYGSSPGYGVGQVETVDHEKNEKETIEKQPEALYRVADEEYKQEQDKSWHRIGSVADETYKMPTIEPGPRNLKIRRKRGVIQRIGRKTNKSEVTADKNQLDNEISLDDMDLYSEQTSQKTESSSTSTTMETPSTTLFITTTPTPATEDNEEVEAQVVELSNGPHKVMMTVDVMTNRPETTTEDGRNNELYTTTEYQPYPSMTYTEETEMTELTDTSSGSSFSIIDLLKRLTTLKLRMGLNFLKSTTDAFSRYLDSIQKRVDDNLDTSNNDRNNYFYNYKRKNWSRSSRNKRSSEDLAKKLRRLLKKEQLKYGDKKIKPLKF